MPVAGLAFCAVQQQQAAGTWQVGQSRAALHQRGCADVGPLHVQSCCACWHEGPCLKAPCLQLPALPHCLQDSDGSPEEVASLIQELLEDKRELLEECFGIQVSWKYDVMLLVCQRSCQADCRSFLGLVCVCRDLCSRVWHADLHVVARGCLSALP